MGANCQDEVACSKMTAKQLGNRYGEEYASYAKLYTGKFAECAVGNYQEDCDALCKVECKEKYGTYKLIIAGIENGQVGTYYYYCPKGKQRYSGDLSAGAIAGIVIA